MLRNYKMITEPKVVEALQWIVEILERHNVPYQISGGVAARFYGATRPINDIDIDIAREGFENILPEVKEYIFFGPDKYKDEKWDIYEMQLRYKGQEIDLTAAECKIYDEKTNTWVDSTADLANTTELALNGLMLKVCSREKLAKYKKMLNGDHQKQDVAEISK